MPTSSITKDFYCKKTALKRLEKELEEASGLYRKEAAAPALEKGRKLLSEFKFHIKDKTEQSRHKIS